MLSIIYASRKWFSFTGQVALRRRFMESYQNIENMSKHLDIVFEDKHLLVINKPCGMLTQSDQSNELCTLEILKIYMKKKYSKPGNVYLSIVHRLDRGTSGIIVYAKNTKAKSRLDEQFRKRIVKKKYIAIVEGLFPESELQGELKHDIHYQSVTGSGGGHSVFALAKKSANTAPLDCLLNEGSESSITTKSLTASLTYVVIGSSTKPNSLLKSRHSVPYGNVNFNLSILDITLLTGRKHQIRVQLESISHPIVGDAKYGSQYQSVPSSFQIRNNENSRSNLSKKDGFALHAYNLELRHPITNEKMAFRSQPPGFWKDILGEQIFEDTIKPITTL